MFSYFNPHTHSGLLPVRVLQQNFVHGFEHVNPNFLETLKYEVDFNNLKPNILYECPTQIIIDCAHIDSYHKIHIFENFLQFVWSMCYSFPVLFDEAIHIPLRDKHFTGVLDLSNVDIKSTLELYKAALSLLKKYEEQIFFDLPNPEKYYLSSKQRIEQANAISVSATVFVLLHEFAHHYLGHLDSFASGPNAKKEEIAADNLAFDNITFEGKAEEIHTRKVGIIIGVGSLILLDDSMSGCEFHPDPDKRLKNMLDKMSLSEMDNIWGIASMICLLWAHSYNKTLILLPQYECYEALFLDIYKKIQTLKY